MEFGLLCHLITSLWILPIRLITVFPFFDGHWCSCSCHFRQYAPHTRVALVDTVASLQVSDWGAPAGWEVHELLTETHGIDTLDIAMCSQVGNTAQCLVYLFNYASRQHHEVWDSQFPFFTTLRKLFILVLLVRLVFMVTSPGPDTASATISLGSSQSSTFIRSGRAKPKARLRFNVKKWPVLESDSASFAKQPCLNTWTESYQDAEKSAGGASASSTEFQEEGKPCVMAFLTYYSLQLQLHHLHLLYRLVHFPIFRSTEKH